MGPPDLGLYFGMVGTQPAPRAPKGPLNLIDFHTLGYNELNI